MHRILFFLPGILLLHVVCTSAPHVPASVGCTVTGTGASLEDAKRSARQAILEDCLGAYVESQSLSRNAQSVKNVVTSSAEGYVSDFQILKSNRSAFGYEIVASGNASDLARKDALRGRVSDLGNPTMMVVIQENLDGQPSLENQSITERSMVSVFQDFEFVDRQQLASILARDRGATVGAYENPGALEKALLAAAELDANYLIVGRTDVVVGGQIEGTSMHSIQTTIGYKVLDVNTAHILAAESTTAAQPHVNPRQGAQQAIKRAVENTVPGIKEQIIARWRAGNVIRLTLEGPTYDQILDSGFLDKLREIHGVSEVSDRGQSAGSVVLEVKAMMSGTRLYGKLREKLRETGFRLEQREIRNNKIRVGLTLPPAK